MELWRRLKRKLLARPEQTVCEGEANMTYAALAGCAEALAVRLTPLSLLRNSLRLRAAGRRFFARLLCGGRDGRAFVGALRRDALPAGSGRASA